jgi:nicotinamidase-related amidase
MSNSPKRALVVIDVQHEYITGKLQVEYPDLRVSLPNIGKAIDAAHEASIPVVVVSHVSPADSPVFGRGSYGTVLHEVVTSRTHTLHLEKSLPSVFAETGLRDWLRDRGIDTVSITGYTTNNCVDSTVKHAMHAGLSVEFLSDASGTFSYTNSAGAATAEEIHRAFCIIIQSRFGAVATTADWIDAVRAGRTLPRDSPIESNRRARAAVANGYADLRKLDKQSEI